jgi:hypothetical protein
MFSFLKEQIFLGMIKGLHVYGQEGFNEFEENIQLELCRLNKQIDSFGDNDFDMVALIQRSLTNVVSQVVRKLYQTTRSESDTFWRFRVWGRMVVEGQTPTINYWLSCGLS